MVIIGILGLVIVVILGVVIIFGKSKEVPVVPVNPEADQVKMLIKATTADHSSSITDPQVQALIKSTSAKESKSINTSTSDREALIRATSGK